MRLDDHALMWRQLLGDEHARGPAPLQVRIRTAIANAIIDGRLPRGLRLPSGRELAELAGVSRNTVVLVYERLVADGYLEARARDGFYVCDAVERSEPAHVAHAQAGGAPDWSARWRGATVPWRWLDRPAGWPALRYPFVYGQFDAKLFPLAHWRECSRRALDVAAVERWAHDGTGGDAPQLIDQLIRRVLPRRGIAAAPDQILLTMGTQHGLYLLAELFAREGTTVGVEDPGYMDARNIFAHRGARVEPLPLDAQGIEISAALGRCGYIYCTPSHQCPTGLTMSTARRLALLEHAQRHDQVLIEDDYDPETQYVGQPLPALKAIDKSDRVIYLSSLSKLLSPGLRIGYIVAPAAVIERLRVLRRLMIRQAPGNNQIAAALFIEQGHYDRLLMQTRQTLGERADTLAQALRQALPEARFDDPQGGSAIWLRLPASTDLAMLRERCLAEGLFFDPAEPFFHGAMTQPHVRLGFSSIARERIAPGVRVFARLVKQSARRA